MNPAEVEESESETTENEFSEGEIKNTLRFRGVSPSSFLSFPRSLNRESLKRGNLRTLQRQLAHQDNHSSNERYHFSRIMKSISRQHSNNPVQHYLASTLGDYITRFIRVNHQSWSFLQCFIGSRLRNRFNLLQNPLVNFICLEVFREVMDLQRSKEKEFHVSLSLNWYFFWLACVFWMGHSFNYQHQKSILQSNILSVPHPTSPFS